MPNPLRAPTNLRMLFLLCVFLCVMLLIGSTAADAATTTTTAEGKSSKNATSRKEKLIQHEREAEALGLKVFKEYESVKHHQHELWAYQNDARQQSTTTAATAATPHARRYEGIISDPKAESLLLSLAEANYRYDVALSTATGGGRRAGGGKSLSSASAAVMPYGASSPPATAAQIEASAPSSAATLLTVLDDGKGNYFYDQPLLPTYSPLGFPSATVRELKAMTNKDLRRFIHERRGRCDACYERRQLLERAYALRSVPTKDEEVVGMLTPYSTSAPARLTTDLLRPQTDAELAASHQHAAQMAIFKDPRFVCEVSMKEEGDAADTEDEAATGRNSTSGKDETAPNSESASSPTAPKKMMPHVSCRPRGDRRGGAAPTK